MKYWENRKDQMDYCQEGKQLLLKMREIHIDERKYPSSRFIAPANACLEEFKQHLAKCETCRQADDVKQAETQG